MSATCSGSVLKYLSSSLWSSLAVGVERASKSSKIFFDADAYGFWSVMVKQIIDEYLVLDCLLGCWHGLECIQSLKLILNDGLGCYDPGIVPSCILKVL